MDDLTAQVDQAEKAAQETARIFSAFYSALIDEMDERTASQLTIMYAARLGMRGPS